MEYDVFISCKSEDYPDGRSVYDFLVRHGLTVFFSDVTLGQLRDADYRKRIDEAIDHSMHMVVVTSKGQYVRSTWVQAEWGIFVNDKRSDRRQGNLVTLLVGTATPSDLPPSLRNYEAFKCDNAGLQRLLNYLPRQQGISGGVAASAVDTKPSAAGKFALGFVGILFGVVLALCANYFAHRSEGVSVNAVSPTAASSPTTTVSLDPEAFPAAERPSPPPIATSAADVPVPVSAADPSAPPSDARPLTVNSIVTVTVDSDLYWDPIGERKGDAKKGQTGRVMQIDSGEARCLVSFNDPINDSAWIAIGAVQPTKPSNTR